MILDMQVDPTEYPDSDSGQDQEWLTDQENFYSLDYSLSASILNNKSQNFSFDNKMAIMSEISNQNSSQNNENSHKNTNETLSKNFKNHEVLLHVVTVGLFCCNCDIDSCQLSRITPVDSQVLTLYHENLLILL